MQIIKPEYKYTGWELSHNALITIQEKIVEKNPTKVDVIEFGSGSSTKVINDFLISNSIPGFLDSFDADPQFANPLARIRNIVSFDGRPISFGNDYSFYDLQETDFRSNNYDLVILDGHHGHGRSKAWDFLRNRLAKGCLVLIDDYDHYPFVEDFLKVFPHSKLVKQHWEPMNRWCLYEKL